MVSTIGESQPRGVAARVGISLSTSKPPFFSVHRQALRPDQHCGWSGGDVSGAAKSAESPGQLSLVATAPGSLAQAVAMSGTAVPVFSQIAGPPECHLWRGEVGTCLTLAGGHRSCAQPAGTRDCSSRRADIYWHWSFSHPILVPRPWIQLPARFTRRQPFSS